VRPLPRYARKLRFVEMDLRPPTPGRKVLARWKGELPGDFTTAFLCPPSLLGPTDWPLRDGAAVRKEIDAIAPLAEAMTPRALVVRTPVAVSPGSVALKRFLAVMAKMHPLAPVRVWEPSGVWEREDAVKLAKEHGIVVASDPLRDEVH